MKRTPVRANLFLPLISNFQQLAECWEMGELLCKNFCIPPKKWFTFLPKKTFSSSPSVDLEDDIENEILWAKVQASSEPGEVLDDGAGANFVKGIWEENIGFYLSKPRTEQQTSFNFLSHFLMFSSENTTNVKKFINLNIKQTMKVKGIHTQHPVCGLKNSQTFRELL